MHLSSVPIAGTGNAGSSGTTEAHEGQTEGIRDAGEAVGVCKRNHRAQAPGEGCLARGSEGRQLLLLEISYFG